MCFTKSGEASPNDRRGKGRLVASRSKQVSQRDTALPTVDPEGNTRRKTLLTSWEHDPPNTDG
jgi:hypothetical protein